LTATENATKLPADLTTIVEAWPNLRDAIKSTILMLVKASLAT
jgi:hypothetical protein